MAFGICKSLLLVAVSLTLTSWMYSAGANPVTSENEKHLRDDPFQAGHPLTEEEFQSGVTENKGATLENGLQPWKHQENGTGLSGCNNPHDTGKKNANKNADVRWPGAQIPYVISTAFLAEERRAIASAMAIYHGKTCIRFVPRSSQRDYLIIIKSSGCWAQKGRVGGAQQMSLGNGCVYQSVILHEFMHAVGFDHEQNRPDQARYITVNFTNILPQHHWLFVSKPRDAVNTIGNYDIKSIMHYGAYASDSVTPSLPTIVAKNGQKVGSGDGFTWMDIYKLNRLYGCPFG
uniref:Metalloendopeptidase n=1 Tax=Daphnia galeata TaxID=27404 RepID=A0A8J2RUY5_9CRUS|nr:unnamed protein product [Daphnia galeata]